MNPEHNVDKYLSALVVPSLFVVCLEQLECDEKALPATDRQPFGTQRRVGLGIFKQRLDGFERT